MPEERAPTLQHACICITHFPLSYPHLHPPFGRTARAHLSSTAKEQGFAYAPPFYYSIQLDRRHLPTLIRPATPNTAGPQWHRHTCCTHSTDEPPERPSHRRFCHSGSFSALAWPLRLAGLHFPPVSATTHAKPWPSVFDVSSLAIVVREQAPMAVVQAERGQAAALTEGCATTKPRRLISMQPNMISMMISSHPISRTTSTPPIRHQAALPQHPSTMTSKTISTIDVHDGRQGVRALYDPPMPSWMAECFLAQSSFDLTLWCRNWRGIT